MRKGLRGWERESCAPAGSQHRTHSGCDYLSSGALSPGLGSRHLQRRPIMSPRGDEVASRPTSIPGWHRSTPQSRPPHPGGQDSPGQLRCSPSPPAPRRLRGRGRTCQLSLLGEVSRAGAAGDTYERGRHLGVPTIDIHVTAGHRQLKTRGTGGLAPFGAAGPGFKAGCVASGMRVRSPGRCNCLPGPLNQL